jgi:type II secretory pathway pseudopilin PulG
VLVVLILAGGLIALLMLNTALNQGSFQLSQFQQRTTALTDERQGLQQQIGAWSAPDALSQRARQLGMMPGGNPAFLQDNGAVLGRPQQLVPTAPPPAPTTTPAHSAAPTPTGTATGIPTPTGAAAPGTALTGAALTGTAPSRSASPPAGGKLPAGGKPTATTTPTAVGRPAAGRPSAPAVRSAARP